MSHADHDTRVRGLKCRLCGKLYPKQALNFCTDDFGPLEVDYDYEAVARSLDRATIERRPRTMWRYRELLPVDGEPTVGRHVGCTPLVKADRLAKAIGHTGPLYLKNDAVNHPTLSFKDRVVAVARKLIAQGKLDPTASTVLCITGNGLKTQEALLDHIPRPKVIDPKLEQFEALVGAAPAEFATVGA